MLNNKAQMQTGVIRIRDMGSCDWMSLLASGRLYFWRGNSEKMKLSFVSTTIGTGTLEHVRFHKSHHAGMAVKRGV